MILSQHNDIAAQTIDTPIGNLLVVANDKGISSITFPMDPFSEVNMTYLENHPEILGDESRDEPRQDYLIRSIKELNEYFQKERQFFDVHYDLGDPTDFRSAILSNLQKVPYGSRVTYSELAAASGNPRAVRAAGSVCATNMIPIMIPCHRVIPAGGYAGNYIAGTKVKEFLLKLEG